MCAREDPCAGCDAGGSRNPSDSPEEAGVQSERPQRGARCGDRRAWLLGSEPHAKASVRARHSWAWLATVALVTILPSCGRPAGAALSSSLSYSTLPSLPSPYNLMSKADPEYSCVYSRDPPRLADRIAATKEYRVHRKEQNIAIKDRCVASMALREPDMMLRIHHPMMASLLEESVSSNDLMGGPKRGEGGEGGSMVVGVWDRIGAQGGAMGVAEWDKDFQGRYKELTPPPPKQHFDGGGASRFSDPDLRSALAGVAGDRLAAAACNGAPSSVVGTTKPLVLMLDLDKCSFFGNDGNDLGIALQWMEKGVEVVEHLYTKLLNPEVGKLYSLITHNYGHHVQPVIYTMRATFLVYHSCFREAVIPLYWKAEWHHGAQIVFPPSVETADDILGTYCGTKQLLEEERVDIKKSLERLLATRTVIRRTLGLTKNPYLVVTAAPKDVSATAQMLGMSDSPSFLWDDNPKLREDPQVVSIPPFVSLPHEAARDLEDWLTTTLPPSELDEYLVEFMLGADERDRVLHRDGNGGTKYVIPRCDSIAPWPLPPALRDTRSDGGDSPVTPVTSGSRSLDSEDEPRQASGAFEEGFQR